MKQNIGLALGILAVSVTGCGSDDASPGDCSVERQTGCDGGLVCESVEGGGVGCFAPLIVEGRVTDSVSSTAIANAVVVARDINGAMASRDTVTTDSLGRYELAIPVTRDADGRPMTSDITLRADAAGHATFPSGLRVALPVDVGQPEEQDERWVVKNASTEVTLDPLASSEPLGTIQGRVRAELATGTLVVAGPASALASRDGTFTIFNVPVGGVEVRGFKVGLSLSPAQADVRSDQVTDGVELTESGDALGSVQGDVNFVNAGTQETSVVLVVESTFNEILARGEVPAGLRQFPVTGRYSFEAVPSGDYVVLAAFENDGLVRDPDMSIGGTAIQRVHVGTEPMSIPNFKITGALEVMGPGADGPESVTGTPMFTWKDDSSEDGYELTVYDNFGRTVFADPDVPRVTGSGNVTLDYAGPKLEPGYYQFRAVSYRLGNGGGTERTYISATEDLKGVFVVGAPR